MAYEYLFSALPPLPEKIGDKVAIGPVELWQLVCPEGGKVEKMARALFYRCDIRAMEMESLGIDPSGVAVIDEGSVIDKSKRPAWISELLERSDQNIATGFKGVWLTYYSRLIRTALRCGSSFVVSYSRWEMAQRNAMAERRGSLFAYAKGDESRFDDVGFIWPYEFKSLTEGLASQLERGFNAWKDVDEMVASLRIEKAKELAPEYSFTFDELMSYVTQYMTYREFSYLK